MRRTLALLAIWLFVLLSPITTWWVVGDLSYKGDPDLDYMVDPLPLTAASSRPSEARPRTSALLRSW